MLTFLKPAVDLMSRLRYSSKFALIAVLAGLPLSLTLYLLVSELNSGIRFAEDEIRGLSLAEDHGAAVITLTEHSYALLRARPPAEVQKLQARMNADLRQLRDNNNAESLRLSSLDILESSWKDLAAGTKTHTRDRIADQHLFLYENLRNGFNEVGEIFHLASDPDVSGLHLAEIVLARLPEGFHLIGEITVLTDRILSGAANDINNRIRLAALANRLKANLDATNRSLELSFREDESIKPELQKGRRSNHIASIRFVNFLLESVVYAAPGQAGQYADFEKKRAELIQSRADLNAAIIPVIRRILVERQSGFELKRNLILAISLLAALLLLYLFAGFYLNVSETVSTLGEVAGQFVSGELTRSYDFKYNDELSQIGQSFNKVGLALTRAKNETDEILQNVDEGLFLIDPDYSLGEQYSARTREILAGQELAHTNFLSLLDRRVPDATLSSTRKYLGQLFKAKVREDFLRDLNPLNEVELFTPENGRPSRHLTFKFNRVTSEKEVTYVMATVRDVTEQVNLARQLKATEEKNTRAMEAMFRIIQSDPQLLREFIADSESDLKLINDLLRKEKNADELRDVLRQAYRIFHSIKGNATIMNLDFIVQNIHDLEERIQELIEKEELEGADFLPVTIGVTEVSHQLEEVKGLVGKLVNFQSGYGADDFDRPEVSNDSFLEPMRSAAARLAGEMDRSVNFDTASFDSALLPEQYRKPIRDILIQMIRNSLTHGIEAPAKREELGKPAAGTITLALASQGESLQLRYHDDGQGINLEGLKERAIRDGHHTREELDTWSPQQVAELIYESGISTAEEAGLLAGRGVGMDVIRDTIRSLQGKIQIKSSRGKYCEFTFLLPPA